MAALFPELILQNNTYPWPMVYDQPEGPLAKYLMESGILKGKCPKRRRRLQLSLPYLPLSVYLSVYSSIFPRVAGLFECSRLICSQELPRLS